VKRVWLNDDLQSFTPLRFMPSELMGHRGRAVIIDGHLRGGRHLELLSRDMQATDRLRALRHERTHRSLHGLQRDAARCAKLTHW
jgi:hypothetical protein